MKKNIIFSMCASLLFLASCDYNEDNFPGYDELAIPKDVQNVELSLADGDYKKVAGYSQSVIRRNFSGLAEEYGKGIWRQSLCAFG